MGTVSKNRGMSCVGVRKTGTTLIRVSTVMGTLYRQSDIISMALRMDDVELLDLAFGFVRGCYNQQIKKEQEAENNGEM